MTKLTRIACVEDDADIRMVINLALADVGGLDVALFANGMEALEGLAAYAPQLVILDVMMPGLDGVETLHQMRANAALAHLPVVFMTAKAQPSEQKTYLKAGAIGVITKPFDPMNLARQVEDIWQAAA